MMCSSCGETVDGPGHWVKPARIHELLFCCQVCFQRFREERVPMSIDEIMRWKRSLPVISEKPVEPEPEREPSGLDLYLSPQKIPASRHLEELEEVPK